MHRPEPIDASETTTLCNGEEPYRKKPTPLPWIQLSILYFIQAVEPFAVTVIFPFINQFVRQTGITKGDERRTGYFAGIVESMFFIGESITVVPWGIASDRFGRRPTLLLGPLGLTLAMFGFGMSTRFWSLVFFSGVQGAFNGNIGIAKSIIGEITDQSNIADAFAFTPVAWAAGAAIGPFIGGFLARPAEEWPNTFGRIAYLKAHPYFLPCAVVGMAAFASFLITFIGLKETLPSASVRQNLSGNANSSAASHVTSDNVTRYGTIHSDHPPAEIENGSNESPLTDDDLKPHGLLEILKLREIQVVLINFGFLGFCDMGVYAFTPLMWSTSIEHGGLGLSSYMIGLAMGWSGVVNAFTQVLFLGKTMRRYGPRRVYIVCFSSLLSTLLYFPISNYFARQANGADWKVWAIVTVSLMTQSLRLGAYGSLMVILTESAPTRSSLGTVNGLAQAVGSVSRSLGPSFVSSLFALSLQRQLAGGNAVYYVMLVIVAIGVRFTFMLPGN